METAPAKITAREVGAVTIIDIEGYLRLNKPENGRSRGADELWNTMQELITDGRPRIIVNLTKVLHLDSASLGRIADGHRLAALHHGTLTVVLVPDSRCDRIFTMTNIKRVIGTYFDEAAALESFTE